MKHSCLGFMGLRGSVCTAAGLHQGWNAGFLQEALSVGGEPPRSSVIAPESQAQGR